MDAKVNEGLLSFTLYRCTDPVEALKEAKNVIEQHLKPETWTEEFLSSAKSSLIFEYIGKPRPCPCTSVLILILNFLYRK